MPKKEFLEELRTQFERDTELKTKLDNKANNMITVSGTIATVFMGFGSFLLTKMDPTKFETFVPASIILMSEIILTTLTINYSISSFSLRTYTYPLGHELFFDEKGNYKQNTAQQFISATAEDFNKRMIEDYLSRIKANIVNNDRKADKIDSAQKMFFLALIMIPIFAFIIILSKLIS